MPCHSPKSYIIEQCLNIFYLNSFQPSQSERPRYIEGIVERFKDPWSHLSVSKCLRSRNLLCFGKYSRHFMYISAYLGAEISCSMAMMTLN